MDFAAEWTWGIVGIGATNGFFAMWIAWSYLNKLAEPDEKSKRAWKMTIFLGVVQVGLDASAIWRFDLRMGIVMVASALCGAIVGMMLSGIIPSIAHFFIWLESLSDPDSKTPS